jgi:hypothetical protein
MDGWQERQSEPSVRPRATERVHLHESHPWLLKPHCAVAERSSTHNQRPDDLAAGARTAYDSNWPLPVHSASKSTTRADGQWRPLPNGSVRVAPFALALAHSGRGAACPANPPRRQRTTHGEHISADSAAHGPPAASAFPVKHRQPYARTWPG